MSEWVFPVLGAAAVFLVAVPLLTLASRLTLATLPGGPDQLAAHGGWLRYLLIVGPTLVPVLWLVSACIHQTEADVPLVACVIDHLGGELCLDVILFGAALTGIMAVSAAGRAWRQRDIWSRRNGVVRDVLARRVRTICEGNTRLAAFSARVDVVADGAAPACTVGLLRPRVEVATSLVARMTDDELEAVLLHEVEHASSHDPARFFLAQVALSVNPIGGLLKPELARHHFAREALCDRRAVQAGADPLTLADCILSVASAPVPAVSVSALGGHGIGGVRLRVQLLLGYADGCPPAPRPLAGRVLSAALLLALIVGPHVTGTGPLDALHHGIEQAALVAGLG